jgi:hypothetical protein
MVTRGKQLELAQLPRIHRADGELYNPGGMAQEGETGPRYLFGDEPPSEVGAHFRAQANFSVRSSFFNAASALSAADLLAKACVPSI